MKHLVPTHRFLSLLVSAFWLFAVGCTSHPDPTPASCVTPFAASTSSAAAEAASGAKVAYVGQPYGGGSGLYVQEFAFGGGALTPAPALDIAGISANYAMTTDASGQLYVGGSYFNGAFSQINVYAAGASGTQAPVRQIVGGAGSFTQVSELAVDAAGELFVEDGAGSVWVFSATANGNAAPVRVIAGANTGIEVASGVTNIEAMTVDAQGELYLALANEPITTPDNVVIARFAAGATGNASPNLLINGVLFDSCESPGNFFYSVNGLKTDASGNLYVLTTTEDWMVDFKVYQNIVELNPSDVTIKGFVTPTKVISGSDTQFNALGLTLDGFALDSAGDLYVLGEMPFVPPSTPAATMLFGFGASGSEDLVPFVNSSLNGSATPQSVPVKQRLAVY